MSLVEGPIADAGAFVDVFIGVSKLRETALRRVHSPVPDKVALRLLIDTGSFITGLPLDALQLLDIEPFDKIPVGTPSTRPDEPHISPLFDVSLHLVSGGNLTSIPSIHVIAGADYALKINIHGILGRDGLRHCNFFYLGKEQRFQLGF